MSLAPIFHTPLNPKLVGELTVMLNELARIYCEEHDKPGGHFCLANERGEPLLILRVNFRDFEEDRAARTLAFCLEKVRRLVDHPEHVASWQSRDPDNSQYGGAIRVPGGFFSFSGLPEHADEALCINGATTFRALTQLQAQYIVSVTGNPHPCHSVGRS